MRGIALAMNQINIFKRPSVRAGAIALAMGVVFVGAIQASEAPRTISGLIDSAPRGLIHAEPVAVATR